MSIAIEGQKKKEKKKKALPMLDLPFPAIKEFLVSVEGIKVIKVDDGLCSIE